MSYNDDMVTRMILTTHHLSRPTRSASSLDGGNMEGQTIVCKCSGTSSYSRNHRGPLATTCKQFLDWLVNESLDQQPYESQLALSNEILTVVSLLSYH